jgi:hypothetical protein
VFIFSPALSRARPATVETCRMFLR